MHKGVSVSGRWLRRSRLPPRSTGACKPVHAVVLFPSGSGPDVLLHLSHPRSFFCRHSRECRLLLRRRDGSVRGTGFGLLSVQLRDHRVERRRHDVLGLGEGDRGRELSQLHLLHAVSRRRSDAFRKRHPAASPRPTGGSHGHDDRRGHRSGSGHHRSSTLPDQLLGLFLLLKVTRRPTSLSWTGVSGNSARSPSSVRGRGSSESWGRRRGSSRARRG